VTPSRQALILNGAELLSGEDELRIGEFVAVSRSIDDLAFTIETGLVRIQETVSGRNLEDFSFVQIASFPNPTGTLLNAVATYLHHREVDAVNAEGVGAPTRLLQYVRFAEAGMTVPSARYLPYRLLEAAYPDLEDQLGLPFILTALRGGGGRSDFLITDESCFAARLRAGGRTQAIFLAREFIPADHSYHLLIMGGEVPIVMHKPFSLDQTHPPGTPAESHAALIDVATFDPRARRLAIQAASLMGYDIASAEMARHCTTGEWYVLNTSPTPPLSGGAFSSDKLSAYTAYLKRKFRAPSESIKSPSQRRLSPEHPTQMDLN
jgi:hypothetical protein